MTDAGIASHHAKSRVDWVDVGKGVCIVLVVMMHSTLGVGIAMGGEGFMHHVVAFSKPFRMPDFFLISGLFLALVVDRPWRTYLDRKVLHFLYFYVLWLLIQGLFKWPGLALEAGPMAVVEAAALSLIEPFGTLWFIYLLPIFFVFAKLVKNVPPLLVLAFAAVLETLRVKTGWTVPDEFCSRLFYVMLGWYAARYVFAVADTARDHRTLAVAGLLAWALANGLAVAFGYSELPGVSLVLGTAGALAIVSASALVSGTKLGEPLRYAGQRSLAIYLAFFLPMAATRVILVKTGVITDIGWVSLIVTVVGVLVPLALHLLVMRTEKGRFLFVRPSWFRLDGARSGRPKLQAAE